MNSNTFLRENLFYKSLLAITCFLLFVIIFYSNTTWKHPETKYRTEPQSLKNGKTFVIEDAFRSFNNQIFEGSPKANRGRFLNNFATIIDTKFRFWLHESSLLLHKHLSLIWVFSLILPYYLFKFVKNYTGNTTIAWNSTLIFIVSSGYLANYTLLFHPGKTLAVFSLLLCLYLFSLFNAEFLKKKKDSNTSSKQTKYFVLLLIVMSVSYFIDETFWFVLVAIPILYFNTFLKMLNKNNIIYPFLFFFSFLVYLLFLAFVVPSIMEALDYPKFSIFTYILSDVREATPNHIGILFPNFCYNVLLTLSSHFLFYADSLAQIYSNIRYFLAVVLMYIFLSYYFVSTHKRLSAFVGNQYVLVILVLFLHLLFHTMLQSRHLGAVGVYYYGKFSSIFLAIILGCVFSYYKKLGKILLVLCIIVIFYNAYQYNLSVMTFHERIDISMRKNAPILYSVYLDNPFKLP